MSELTPPRVHAEQSRLHKRFPPAVGGEKTELTADTNRILHKRSLSVPDFRDVVNKMIKLQGGSKPWIGGSALSTITDIPEIDGSIQLGHRKNGGYIDDWIDVRLPLDPSTDIIVRLGANDSPSYATPFSSNLREPNIAETSGFRDGYFIIPRDQQLSDDTFDRSVYVTDDTRRSVSILAGRLLGVLRSDSMPQHDAQHLERLLSEHVTEARANIDRKQQRNAEWARRNAAVASDSLAASTRRAALSALEATVWERISPQLKKVLGGYETLDGRRMDTREEFIRDDDTFRNATKKIEREFDQAAGFNLYTEN